MKTKKCMVVLIGMIFAAKCFSQSIPSYVPKNGLVGWWPFNGNVNDESGNGNNGSVKQGVSLTKDRYNSNTAYEFNGAGNIALSFLPTNGSSDFTICAWIKTSDTLTRKGIAGWGEDNPWNSTYFYITKSGHLKFDFAYNNGPESPTIISDNKWHSVAVSCLNGLIQLYLDGELSGESFKMMPPKIFGNNKVLGANIDNSGENNFTGKLDDIGIWNRSLSQTEIKSFFLDCQKQTATTTSFNKLILTNSDKFSIDVIPTGGTLHGSSIINNQIDPSKSKLGKNNIDYFFKNDSGCDDSTRFTYVVYDTLGLTCTKTTYDTITTKTTVTDTLKIKVGITTGLYVNQVNLIKIFPNPTASDLVIDFGNQEMIKGYSLTINDISGKQVYKENILTQKSIVKLSSLGGKGLYFVNIVDANSKVLVVKQIILE